MGIMDKLKGAVNVMTGGAAKVSIEYPPSAGAGDTIEVRITITSTGAEVKSKGIFVDLKAEERVEVRKGQAVSLETDVVVTSTTYESQVPVAPAFVLGAGETRQFNADVQIPPQAQPSYEGRSARHRWQIRGRMEAFGNDPDSGWLDFRVSP